jgi:hypothetical protein
VTLPSNRTASDKFSSIKELMEQRGEKLFAESAFSGAEQQTAVPVAFL